MQWVAAPDEAVLQRVAAALDNPQRSGVVLVGSDGVGKTLLAPLRGPPKSAPLPSSAGWRAHRRSGSCRSAHSGD